MGAELVLLDIETGVLGILRGEKQGPEVVTLLGADIEALPRNKQDSNMHRILDSHARLWQDGHTGAVLEAARLLSSMRDQFSGTIKLILSTRRRDSERRQGDGQGRGTGRILT